MKKAPIALLLAVAAGAIIAAPTSAITLTKHIVIPHGVTHKSDEHRVVVTTIAPPDSDEDGFANSEDSCPHEAGSIEGCQPEPVAAPVSESVAPAPVPSTVAPVEASTGSYSIPSYIVACESGGDYNAQNASGAYGAYQIMPGTASAYGCDLSSAAGQDACAAEIYSDVGSSAWVCG